jgi:hypothetical protein
MSPNARPAASRLRSRPLVVILLLTLVLAGVLTYEAWDAARRHRATAEQSLREYAAFAAWEFNSSVKEQLYSHLVWILAPIAHSEPQPSGVPLASPAILASAFDVKREYRCDPGLAPALFRVDIGSGAITTRGTEFSGGMSAWVRDTVLADVRGGRYWRDYLYSAIFGTVDGGRRSIVYQVKWDALDRPVAAYGFEFCMRRFATPSI